MKNFDLEKLNWDKINNLIPVIIQDANSSQVLMLGYMNREALEKTLASQQVTFYSRTKQRLWTKGETSGNFLKLIDISTDCDNDALLIRAHPAGPCCHLQTTSCFNEEQSDNLNFLIEIEKIIQQRYRSRPENSYTAELFNQGIKRIAQKVGEEGLEVALAAVTEEKSHLINETADLLYHLLVLLCSREINFSEVLSEMQNRHLQNSFLLGSGTVPDPNHGPQS